MPRMNCSGAGARIRRYLNRCWRWLWLLLDALDFVFLLALLLAVLVAIAVFAVRLLLK
jgi:hypothetical protein